MAVCGTHDVTSLHWQSTFLSNVDAAPESCLFNPRLQAITDNWNEHTHYNLFSIPITAIILHNLII